MCGIWVAVIGALIGNNSFVMPALLSPKLIEVEIKCLFITLVDFEAAMLQRLDSKFPFVEGIEIIETDETCSSDTCPQRQKQESSDSQLSLFMTCVCGISDKPMKSTFLCCFTCSDSPTPPTDLLPPACDDAMTHDQTQYQRLRVPHRPRLCMSHSLRPR